MTLTGREDPEDGARAQDPAGWAVRGGVPPDATSTIELLERVRGGDGEARETLVVRYLAPLRRWASGRLPVRARGMIDTDDLVQNAMVQTLRHVDVLSPRRAGGLQAYLRQAVMNGLRDELRRAKRRPGTPLGDDETFEPEHPGPSPLEETLGIEAVALYDAALARLRPADREAVLARVELGLDYGAIALALDKPSADAARMAVSRALLKLAEEVRRGA